MLIELSSKLLVDLRCDREWKSFRWLVLDEPLPVKIWWFRVDLAGVIGCQLVELRAKTSSVFGFAKFL